MTASLAPELEAALALVRQKLEAGDRIGPELDRAIGIMGDLAPEQIARADAAVANAGGLYRRTSEPSASGFLLPRRVDQDQLLRTPGLAYLFLFHRDGWLREAGLKRLVDGLPSPFLFAAVAWRLNDWVAPVREAAVACAERCFPRTDPDVVARCAAALVIRRLGWGRWSGERDVLDRAFGRADVAASLADLLVGGAMGPLATILRAALRSPALDRHLTRVAQDAIQPSVRAAALAALIDRHAAWPSGYGWRWLDKSMGERRRVLVHDERDLTIAVDRGVWIDRGVRDRSPIVRRAALDGVMRHLKGRPEARDHAAALLADSSASVRERAEFIMRREAD